VESEQKQTDEGAKVEERNNNASETEKQ